MHIPQTSKHTGAILVYVSYSNYFLNLRLNGQIYTTHKLPSRLLCKQTEREGETGPRHRGGLTEEKTGDIHGEAHAHRRQQSVPLPESLGPGVQGQASPGKPGMALDVI